MKGNWIITHTGKKVYPLDFRPAMFDIEDIAHSLAMLCRYTGHCPKFYSVAEHSILVAEEVIRLTGGDTKLGLQALLHDAAEAYISDVAQPLKHCEEFAFYKTVERNIEQTIFDLHRLPRLLSPVVKLVDMGMLLKEGYLFFPESIAEWTYPPKDTPIPGGEIYHLRPREAKHYFRTFYADLTDGL